MEIPFLRKNGLLKNQNVSNQTVMLRVINELIIEGKFLVIITLDKLIMNFWFEQGLIFSLIEMIFYYFFGVSELNDIIGTL